jgi:hypothetical protein
MKRKAPIRRKSPNVKRRVTGCQVRGCTRRGPFAEVPERRCKFHLKQEADRLMSLYVREDELCWCCGASERLQWAHVHSRRYMAIRWNMQNSTVLCAPCHQHFTHRPLEWETWCRDHGIPWDELRVKALTSPPMDPAEVIRALREAE